MEPVGKNVEFKNSNYEKQQVPILNNFKSLLDLY